MRQGQLIVNYKYAIHTIFITGIVFKLNIFLSICIFFIYRTKGQGCNFILIYILPLFQFCTKIICKYFLTVFSENLILGSMCYYKIVLNEQMLYDITKFYT